jgi:recombinational DNA repair protein RecR
MSKDKILCDVCFKRKAKESGKCAICEDMHRKILKLITDVPKQANNYFKKIYDMSSKAVRNRYMSTKVGG